MKSVSNVQTDGDCCYGLRQYLNGRHEDAGLLGQSGRELYLQVTWDDESDCTILHCINFCPFCGSRKSLPTILKPAKKGIRPGMM